MRMVTPPGSVFRGAGDFLEDAFGASGRAMGEQPAGSQGEQPEQKQPAQRASSQRADACQPAAFREERRCFGARKPAFPCRAAAHGQSAARARRSRAGTCVREHIVPQFEVIRAI